MSAVRALLVGVAATLLSLSVWAQVNEAAERARIGRERAEAQARFEQRQRDCSQRFAVTPCVEEARAEHRQAMIQLRRQQAVLDEAQRKQRAAARLAAIEEKRRAEAQRVASTPATGRVAMPMQAKPPRQPASASAPAAAARPASAQASSAAVAEREQHKRAQFEARQREAQAHREQSERRRAERAAAGKASAPLPDPAAR